MMELLFPRAAAFVLAWEGGYVRDPADLGGETNFGISKRHHPALDIRDLTREQAEEIYRREYWMPLHCGILPPPLAVAVFDTAVNMGVGTARKLTQKALGVAADGVWGAVTWDALHTHPAPLALAEGLLAERKARYGQLVERNPGLERFRRGWWRRLEALAGLAASLSSSS